MDTNNPQNNFELPWTVRDQQGTLIQKCFRHFSVFPDFGWHSFSPVCSQAIQSLRTRAFGLPMKASNRHCILADATLVRSVSTGWPYLPPPCRAKTALKNPCLVKTHMDHSSSGCSQSTFIPPRSSIRLDTRFLRSDLDGLLTQDDQLSPRLSNAEGSLPLGQPAAPALKGSLFLPWFQYSG